MNWLFKDICTRVISLMSFKEDNLSIRDRMAWFYVLILTQYQVFVM